MGKKPEKYAGWLYASIIEAPCYRRLVGMDSTGLETMDLIVMLEGSCGEGCRQFSYLDCLCIKFQALLLVCEKLLNILALIALELDHLSHLGVDDDGAIASYHTHSSQPIYPCPASRQACCIGDLPNFFLMTLRIFFWSNFFGRPWTVVKVLRPLRSAGRFGQQVCLIIVALFSRADARPPPCHRHRHHHHNKSRICNRRAEKGQTYAEYGCVCSFATALFLLYLRRLRRRGL